MIDSTGGWYFINFYANGKISTLIVDGPGWRWGYGIYALCYLPALLPVVGIRSFFITLPNPSIKTTLTFRNFSMRALSDLDTLLRSAQGAKGRSRRRKPKAAIEDSRHRVHTGDRCYRTRTPRCYPCTYLPYAPVFLSHSYPFSPVYLLTWISYLTTLFFFLLFVYKFPSFSLVEPTPPPHGKTRLSQQ